LHEAFMVRAELESLATEVAATKMTPDDLAELDACERHFSSVAQEMRAREPGDERRSITGDWVRANHAFHDVIYRVADLPLVEQLAKSARRTFSGPAVWAPGDHSLDGLYLKNAEQHRAIKQALAAGSPEGRPRRARRAPSRADGAAARGSVRRRSRASASCRARRRGAGPLRDSSRETRWTTERVARAAAPARKRLGSDPATRGQTPSVRTHRTSQRSAAQPRRARGSDRAGSASLLGSLHGVVLRARGRRGALAAHLG